MTLQHTLERLRALGYEPGEPEACGPGLTKITMPGRISGGTLTLLIERDGTYHRPGQCDRTGQERSKS